MPSSPSFNGRPLIDPTPDNLRCAHLHAHTILAPFLLHEGTVAMPRPAAARANRRATNVTLPIDLLDEARAFGLNISQACELGLKAELARSRAAQWLEENREALLSSNAYVERNGLPLSQFRQF